MKKIYFEPEMHIMMPQLTSDMLIMSLEDNDPTNGLGGGGTDPGKTPGEDDDEGDIWGGAKGRGMWDSDGLW